MEKRPNATLEMIQFVSEQNKENNEKQQKRIQVIGKLKKKKDQIADAIIGIGVSLNSLNDQKIEIEKELQTVEKETVLEPLNDLFVSKFGVNMYAIDLNPTLTQKEVDDIKTEDD